MSNQNNKLTTWLTIGEIFGLFKVSEQTIRRHIKRIIKKEGLPNQRVRKKILGRQLIKQTNNWKDTFIYQMISQEALNRWKLKERPEKTIQVPNQKIRQEVGQDRTKSKRAGKMIAQLKQDKERLEEKLEKKEPSKIIEPSPVSDIIKTLEKRLEGQDRQLERRDKQIDKFLERYREIHILLGNLQKRLQLPAPKEKPSSKEEIIEED